jgi:hypothetical protein
MRGVIPSLDLRGHFCAGRADDQGEQTRSAAAHLQKTKRLCGPGASGANRRLDHVVLTIGSFTGEHCDVR